MEKIKLSQATSHYIHNGNKMASQLFCSIHSDKTTKYAEASWEANHSSTGTL